MRNMAGSVGWMECGAVGDANGKEEGKGGQRWTIFGRLEHESSVINKA
jgi:hypothetical protein